MKTIEGIYSSATIFTTDNKETGIDPYAIAQIQMLCDNEASKGSKIRIMPDVHPGKVGTIDIGYESPLLLSAGKTEKLSCWKLQKA